VVYRTCLENKSAARHREFESHRFRRKVYKKDSMNKDLEKGIERAQALLSTARHACMATVNKDGSPHNTPFRFLYDPKLEFVYWGSHQDSLHSLNVIRTGKIFVVLYDLVQRGGLYMKCGNAHVLEGDELTKALEVHNSFRIKEGSKPLTLEYYIGNSPQRMWSARIIKFWVNGVELDTSGHIIKDIREEITNTDLIGN
jgi:hypothetical protein